MDRILITGTHSGCGKTTVTCALLMALKKRGLSPAAFKCGPDYIDPMFHRSALGVPSRNLDPFFSDAGQLQRQLAACTGGIAVLEGVMGYYDGVNAQGRYSTFDVARATKTPAVLVVDVKAMYTSAGAVLKGFSEYRAHSGIKGVIFNGASPGLYEGLSSIARELGVTPLGYLPREAKARVESRHLGLVTAGEIDDMSEKLTLLGDLAQRYIDIEGLVALAASAPPLEAPALDIPPLGAVRIGVARDKAFCFLYEENLELLRALGCELVFFSPLADTALPEGIGGLYLCGGYPELYAGELSKNEAMRSAVQAAVLGGMPTIAECGGFLYLHDTLDGQPMAGVIHEAASKAERLQPFGYITLVAKEDNLLCEAFASIRAHEFHYYESTGSGASFTAEKPLSQRSWPGVHATKTLYAGFPHLYFYANPNFARNFIKGAMKYENGNNS